MGVSVGPDVVENGLVLSLDPATSNTYSKNVHPKPTDIYGWCVDGGLGGVSGTVGANDCIISKDTTIVSPVGGNPLRMFVTGTDPHIACYNSSFWNLFPAAIGETWTISVYVRASKPTTAQIFVLGAPANGNVFDATFGEIAAGTVSVGTDWSRVSYTYTFTKPVSFIQLRLDGPDTQAGGNARGETIWWDGLQVENQTSATTFDGTRATTASIVDKFDNVIRPINAPTYNTAGYFDFDHTKSQYLSLGNLSSLQFLDRSPFTLEAWVYPTRNPGVNNWTGIFDRESTIGSSRNGYNIYFLGSAGSTTTWAIERFTEGVAASAIVSLNQSETVNKWQHIVGTYDGTNLSLYRNGSLVNTYGAAATGNLINTTKSLTIGLRGGQYFGGRISNAKVYNKALTATEVAQNFATLRGRFGI